MKVIRCDKCGKEFNRKTDQHGKFEIQKQPTYWGSEVLTHKFDLCPGCADEIVKLIVGEEVILKEEENVENQEADQTN